jgi:hypothetical protein
MESLFYELRPWAFAAVGTYYTFNSTGSTLLLVSGGLMAFASGLIIYARSKARARASTYRR